MKFNKEKYEDWVEKAKSLEDFSYLSFLDDFSCSSIEEVHLKNQEKRNKYWLENPRNDFFKELLSLIDFPMKFFYSYTTFKVAYVSPTYIVFTVWIQVQRNKLKQFRVAFSGISNLIIKKTVFDRNTLDKVEEKAVSSDTLRDRTLNAHLYRPVVYEDNEKLVLTLPSMPKIVGSSVFVSVYELSFSYESVSYQSEPAPKQLYRIKNDNDFSFAKSYPKFEKFFKTQKFKKREKFK